MRGIGRRGRLGVVTMLWGDSVSVLTPQLLAKVSAMGYDLIEVPLFGEEEPGLATVGRRIRDAGLASTVNTALPPGRSLLDLANQRETVAFLGGIAAQARVLGATLVCGPLLTPVGALPQVAPGPAERAAAVAGLAAAAARADAEGVTLALEPLNRFESAYPNTVADACALIDAVAAPNCGLLLDTFHMNIEERSPAAAIRLAGARVRHIHCSENDRGPVGSGHIPWDAIESALAAIGYAGDRVVESFGATIPAISRACCVWRPLAASADELAAESAVFLRRLRVRHDRATTGTERTGEA